MKSILRSLISIFFLFSVSVAMQATGSLKMSLCWKFPAQDIKANGIASDNVSAIFMPTFDKTIIAIDKLGQAIWTSDVNGVFASKLFYSSGHLYFLSKSDDGFTKLTAMSAETGLTMWQKILPASEGFDSEILRVTIGDVFTLQNGTLVRYNPETGAATTSFRMDHPGIVPYISESKRAFEIDETNGLISIDLEDGQKRRIADLGAGKWEIKNIDNSGIFIANNLGAIVLVLEDRKRILWKNRVGAGITSLSIHKNKLYINSIDNYLYCFRIETGKILWRKRLSGRTEGVYFEPKNTMISSMINGNQTFFTDATDGKEMFELTKLDNEIFLGNPQIFFRGILLVTNEKLEYFQPENCQ